MYSVWFALIYCKIKIRDKLKVKYLYYIQIDLQILILKLVPPLECVAFLQFYTFLGRFA
jgi:hypothetical protein